MAALMADEALRRRLAGGRPAGRARYTWEARARRHLEIYDEVTRARESR